MTPTPAGGRWLYPGLFAVAGAALYSALWFAFDRIGADGGGRMQTFGWPFNSVWTLAVLGAISGSIFGRAFYARRVLAQQALADPVEPAADEDDDENDSSAAELAALPDVPVFANRVSLARRSAERHGDVAVDLFDLTTEIPGGDNDTRHVTRTYALLSAEGVPAFDLRPVGAFKQLQALVGIDGIRFHAAAARNPGDAALVTRFESTYRLARASYEAMMAGTVAGDDDAVRKVFTLNVIQAALARGDWHVQCHGGHVAFWVGPEPLGPQRRAKLVDGAVALRAALLAAHTGADTSPVVPAPPGAASSERQAARFQAAQLGALLGGFIGFFGAGTLNAMHFLSEPGKPSGSMAVSLIALAVLGAFLGGLIGRSLPLRRPPLRKPKDARREKVVGFVGCAGLFAGFLGGGVAGAAVAILMDLSHDEAPLLAGLFFGGIGLGTITGPVLFAVAANYAYTWVTGRRE